MKWTFHSNQHSDLTHLSNVWTCNWQSQYFRLFYAINATVQLASLLPKLTCTQFLHSKMQAENDTLETCCRPNYFVSLMDCILIIHLHTNRLNWNFTTSDQKFRHSNINNRLTMTMKTTHLQLFASVISPLLPDHCFHFGQKLSNNWSKLFCFVFVVDPITRMQQPNSNHKSRFPST